MFKLFEIREGKFKALPSLSPSKIKGFFIASTILFVVSLCAGWLKMDEKDIWKFYTTLIQTLGLQQQLPKLPDNEKKLEAEIELNIDKAIRDYEASLPPETPRMTNKTILNALQSSRFSDTQRLVVKDAIYYECPGGVMGIRGAWVDKDPECH